MKATLKQLATGTFIALLLVVVNVKAEAREIKSVVSENTESALLLEKWMTDDAIWTKNDVNITEIIQETEPALKVDDWMLNPEIWNSNFSIVDEVESGLKVENWMINDAMWNINSSENEPTLQVESWMTDKEIWK